jgi:site-specific DNA-adenine methylase
MISFNSIPSRLLTASQHLGERFNELKQNIESIPDESIREQSKQALDAILGEAQKTLETDIRVEFVRRFLVDGWQGFAQNTGHGWGAKKHLEYDKMLDSTNLFNSVPSRLITASPHLQEISELKKVYLENDDFEKVCRRWQTDHTLTYCDSPYLGKEDYYSEKFTLDDHYRLADVANTIEGHVILSYYPDPLLDKLYPENDWQRFYKETVASSAGVTRNSKTKTRPKRTEMLLVRKNRNPSKTIIDLSGQLKLF